MSSFTWMTRFQAAEVLATLPVIELRQYVVVNNQDFYGVMGWWAYTATHVDLLAWWHSHYTWDEKASIWMHRREFADA